MYARACLAACLSLLLLAGIPPAGAQDSWRERERSSWREYTKRFERGERTRGIAGGDWRALELVIQPSPLQRRKVRVGEKMGRIGRVGVHMREGSIDLVEISVLYANGKTQTFSVNERLARGARARAFELAGESRYVNEVSVLYRPIDEAAFAVLADPERPSRPSLRWEQLGCQSVGLFDFADVISVGGHEGSFGQLKLTADGGNVRLDRLRIYYGNGASQDISVRTVIPDGRETEAIDLTGRQRFIERIELYYIPSFSAGGHATVCAFGS